MLTHKRVVVASLVTTMVLASLMSMSSVRATTYAEAPPYDDKWTLTTGSNYPYADANVSNGRLIAFMYPLTTETSTAHVKMWKRVWLPAIDLEITCLWRLEGYLMCGLWLSFTGVDLYLFVEKSINSGTIIETTLFHKYVDLAFEYQESIDEPWQSPPPIVVSIPEAGYYNIGAGLAGEAGGLIASCAFGGGESDGAWVSMKISAPTLSISAFPGGTTDPAPGTYTYGYGTPVTVTAYAYNHYTFSHWLLDGVTKYGNPITVTMNSDHTLEAHFSFFNNPPNTPSTPSGPTSGYRNVWYTYSTTATDPDGDNIRYEFEFSGPIPTVSFTTGWYASDQNGNITVQWEPSDPLGTYYVRVRAQDVYEEWSNWSPYLTVKITKLVNLVVNVPQAPPEGVKVWVDGTTYKAYASSPVSVTVKAGQHTIEAERSFLKEGGTPGTYFFYFFDCWSDGSKDNPRTMPITSGTTLTAYYIRSEYGWNSEQPEQPE